ncbi:hypothetical protein VNO80_30331 [Phaseolus coccineus]|uniref:Uncharacterized protein n=1 Tax=Phaseolus coccineus TaxID=3886 RepID=A0AAN9LD22_PHACN
MKCFPNRKENEKKSKIDGDDGGVAYGGTYRGVRERICTEKRKKKQITVVKQQKQVQQKQIRWKRRTGPVEEKRTGPVEEKRNRSGGGEALVEDENRGRRVFS